MPAKGVMQQFGEWTTDEEREAVQTYVPVQAATEAPDGSGESLPEPQTAPESESASSRAEEAPDARSGSRASRRPRTQ